MIEINTIRAFLANRDEMPTIEFKAQYLFTGQGNNKRRDECAKDIIALTNTAGRNISDYAYLIIGASDKFNAKGERDLTDVQQFQYKRKTFLDIVNSRCHPQIPNLIYDDVELDGIRLGVILVPPSPYVHALSRDLDTPKGPWRKNSVLIRRGDETGVASFDEISRMKKEKEKLLTTPEEQDEDSEMFVAICADLERKNACAFEAPPGSDLRRWAERMADRGRLVRSTRDLFVLAHHINPHWPGHF